jgi:hypothetical protein
LQDGLSFAVEVFDRDKAVQFVDYHWNLSTMLKQSRGVGFRLLALTELPDAPGGNPRALPGSALNSAKPRSRAESNANRPASMDPLSLTEPWTTTDILNSSRTRSAVPVRRLREICF